MAIVRTWLAAFLAIALCGAAATSTAHAHDSVGHHGVHIVMYHHHDDDHHGVPHDESAASDEESTSLASDHIGTGFHSHAAPQFAPVGSTILAFVSLTIGWIDFFDTDDLATRTPDESPFKPPRPHL